jgi:single-stranded DNA-binding protein
MNAANNITLIGTVAGDPQIRKIQGSFHLLVFPINAGLVVSADGPMENEHLRVILWRQAGDLLLTKLKDGSLVSIKGNLQKAAMAAYHDEQLLEISGGELTLLTN